MRRALPVAMAIGLILGSAALGWADEQADAMAIVDKAIAAMGGEAKLRLTATTFKMKFTSYQGDSFYTFAGEVFYQSEEKFRQAGETERGGQRAGWIYVLNGDKAWDSLNGKVTETTAQRFPAAKENLYSKGLARVIVLKDKAIKLSLLGETQINGRPVVGIRVKHPTYRDVDMFFDKETHLLAMSRRTTPASPNTKDEIFYSDYTEEAPGGATYPSRITIKREGKVVWEEERSGVKRHEKLDDKLFEKP